MEAIVNALPASWRPKAKAIVSAIGAVLIVVVAVVPDLPKWAAAVVAAATLLGVYQAPAVDYVGPTSKPPTP